MCLKSPHIILLQRETRRPHHYTVNYLFNTWAYEFDAWSFLWKSLFCNEVDPDDLVFTPPRTDARPWASLERLSWFHSNLWGQDDMSLIPAGSQ